MSDKEANASNWERMRARGSVLERDEDCTSEKECA